MTANYTKVRTHAKLSELLMNFFKNTEAGPHILGSGLG